MNLSRLELKEGLERLQKEALIELIRAGEARYTQALEAIAERIRLEKRRVLFISGPSGSGKTSTARRIEALLDDVGIETHTISLDDYYKANLEPELREGRPDLESLSTLDLAFFEAQFLAILRGERVELPQFDFAKRQRVLETGQFIQLKEGEVLVVEGLHGLAKEIQALCPPGETLSLFLSPMTEVWDGETLYLSASDLRLVRRLCRDRFHRGTSVTATLDYAPMLRYAEEQFFPDYRARAELNLDTLFLYELAILPALARDLIEEEMKALASGIKPEAPKMTRNYQDFADFDLAIETAKQLSEKLACFPQYDRAWVAPQSILNEFVKEKERFPKLGLGLYKTDSQTEMNRAVSTALEAGYTLFDTAAMYGNETELGVALKQSGRERSAYFVTTKVWTTAQREGRVYEEALASLERLGLETVDLLLLHWPVRENLEESWRQLERLHQEGKARFIGMGNATQEDLERILHFAKVKPLLNQVECHPALPQRELKRYCQAEGIQLQAYCPIMRGRLNEVPLLLEMAKRYGKTVPQLLLRWQEQNGVSVIPKSVRVERIRENADIFDFTLTEEDLRAMDGLETGDRICSDPRSFDF